MTSPLEHNRGCDDGSATVKCADRFQDRRYADVTSLYHRIVSTTGLRELNIESGD